MKGNGCRPPWASENESTRISHADTHASGRRRHKRLVAVPHDFPTSGRPGGLGD